MIAGMFGRREKPIGQLSPQFGPSLFFSIMLLALGAGIAWAGQDAITRQYYELEWKSSGINGASSGVLTLDGTAAVRFGVGLMSFGIMMGTWGVGVVVWFAQKYSPSFVIKILSGLKWLSFACMLTAMTCIFPPWKMSSIPFWVVVMLVLMFVFALPDVTRKNWAGGFFIGLIGAAIVYGSINVGAGAGMGIGIFMSLAIFVHIIFLFPKLEKKLLPDDNAVS